jgi:hypothetical protein
MNTNALITKLPLKWEAFYEPCKPENLFSLYFNVKTVYDSISKQRVILGEVTDHYGSIKHKKYGNCDFILFYYFEWLNFLNEVSNINKPLPQRETERLARILMVEYYHFYISDLKLILMGILEGEYGKFFGSVDSQLILTAFKEYNMKRRKLIKELAEENKKYQ